MTSRTDIIKAQEINFLKKNWKLIPEKYKENLKPNRYSTNIKDLSLEEHFAVLLLDRQKPSVARSWDFDEERIGITREGKVIWGFDSGCSCPTPWDDAFPDCYKVSKSWKEFEVNLKDFDVGVIEECRNKINEIKKELEVKQ